MIDIVEKFISMIVPGNYALTKSMELTRIESSGTLWYTKKFLVLYYYIFLTDDIFTREYINKVICCFDNYISTLDDSVKDSAKKFFYPDNYNINFKSDKFKTFIDFTINSFESNEEKTKYYQLAKKYYFILLMGAGGQSGIKKCIKNAIEDENFVFSIDNLKTFILDAAIKVTIEQCNLCNEVTDNSVPYVISKEAIEYMERLSKTKKINKSIVKQTIKNYPKNDNKIIGIINDMPAFLRNERQVLYYYGYFHSKSSGAKDVEFSSLTPVGEMSLFANSNEFLAIWEHQKLKMISQPITVEIKNVPEKINSDNFSISFNPYLDILKTLLKRNELSLDDYKYIVSRKNGFKQIHLYEVEELDDTIEDEIFDSLNLIKDKVSSYGRTRDIEDEDSGKELKKYLLGIRNDLNMDKSTNPIGILSWKRRENVRVTNNEALKFMSSIYTSASRYKIMKYLDLFKQCESDLKKRYKDNSIKIDESTKIHWDLYNINLDKFIILNVLLSFASVKEGYYSINEAISNINIISDYIARNFESLIKYYGISRFSISKELGRVINCINDGDYSYYIESNTSNEELISKYKEQSSDDLLNLIEHASYEKHSVYGEAKNRNSNLVRLMKSYYIINFINNNTLKCEVCGNESFIARSGEPYVEFHHLIPFKEANGPDHYYNIFALCPECHRKLHFLPEKLKKDLYDSLNKNNYFQINIVDRLKKLKKDHILKSYHLEYLYADKAITEDEYNLIAA